MDKRILIAAAVVAVVLVGVMLLMPKGGPGPSPGPSPGPDTKGGLPISNDDIVSAINAGKSVRCDRVGENTTAWLELPKIRLETMVGDTTNAWLFDGTDYYKYTGGPTQTAIWWHLPEEQAQTTPINAIVDEIGTELQEHRMTCQILPDIPDSQFQLPEGAIPREYQAP